MLGLIKGRRKAALFFINVLLVIVNGAVFVLR